MPPKRPAMLPSVAKKTRKSVTVKVKLDIIQTREARKLIALLATMAWLHLLSLLFSSQQTVLRRLQISPNAALKVLLQFDRAINSALAGKVRSRISFKASKLNTYRFCDNVWTFLMSDVEFKEVQDFVQVEKLKIVACDGRGPGPGGASGGGD
ncbi:Transcription initiation factor IIA subunit 2 [Portunus trituberculatus]|uniref:Transcription initiation factor IIA subunit 2 n=1 Tax=Portunus trituberculatus TaxID=210409 RepID=A0A5B7EDW4_PORTR|nr:Transcription initiation factor IIA subunit 2 [Portunus trituberculatus]